MKRPTKRNKVLKLLLDGSNSVKDVAKKAKCSPDYVYQLRSARDKRYMEKRKEEIAAQPVKPQQRMTPILTTTSTIPLTLTTTAPNDTQVGGTHYKDKDIQPWDAIHAWGLGFFSGNVVKYVARHHQKGGVDDLRKARHYLDKLIELHTKGG